MDTERFTVSRPVPADTIPPNIVILSPTERVAPPNTEQLFIQGKVTDDKSIHEVKVGGHKVRVTADGSFAKNIKLRSGENEILISATDVQGNVGTNRLTVHWTPPPNPGPDIRILNPVYDHEREQVYHPARGLKPIITIDGASVDVYGEVKDEDGVSEVRIDGAKVSVNGKNFEKSIPLNYGDNSIHVTATDKLGNQTEEKIYVYRPPNIRKDYALLFAVEDYDHWPNLRNPIPDAQKIQQDLEDIYGFKTRLIKNPTKLEIFRVFREYAEMVYTDDSQLFIFFAGHGHFDDNSEKVTLLHAIQKCQKMTLKC